MPIVPEERSENLKASIFKYIEANFTTTPVDYAGAGLDESDYDEWVRADVMLTPTIHMRQVGGGLLGGEASVLVNLNIFHKQSELQSTNIYRIQRIRDELANLFRVPVEVPIKDWVENAGANTVGTALTFELEDQDLGLQMENTVYQYNLTSTLRYIFKWEP
jgi:hypothetical protein